MINDVPGSKREGEKNYKSSNPAAAVLIIGAGPTGLTMANLLARMKVPFVLIDKAEGPLRGSNAFGIMPVPWKYLTTWALLKIV